MAELLPGAEPFASAGGPVGVLFCHGFTGCPQSLRPWAEAVTAAGYATECPLLPGHGTRWQDLNRTRWPQWYAAVDAGLDRLLARCSTVVVAGLSVGGCLALRLAEQRPADVAGLVLVNPSVVSRNRVLPALPVLRYLVPSMRAVANDIRRPGAREVAYDRTPLRALSSVTDLWPVTRDDLHLVTAPLLVFRSAQDHVVEADSTELVLAGVSSAERQERVLTESFHVATLDHDADVIVAGTLDFLRARTAAAAAG